jgi:hypothetical protein
MGLGEQQQPMAIDILNPSDIIEQMIDLRIRQADLEQQIQALRPAFFDACAQQTTDRLENERALIYRRLTPSKWNYDLTPKKWTFPKSR